MYPNIILAFNVCLSRCIFDPKWTEGASAELEYVPINANKCDVFVKKYKGVAPRTWLPDIVRTFLQAREEERALKNAATDPFIKLCHEMAELAYKNSSNAVYGFFGSRVSGATCFAVARMITGIGRFMALNVRHQVISNGGALLGGDTVRSLSSLHLCNALYHRILHSRCSSLMLN